METIKAEHLGRAGVGIAEEIGYKRGYRQGIDDTLKLVENWVADLQKVRKELLGGKENED